MKLASVLAKGRGETNRLLSDLAARAARVVGTVQVNHDPTDSKHCDMDVRVLPDGPVLRISQSLGMQSRGCRLDPSALEQAVRLTEGAMESGADLMIVNKFGKHEAEGRGFRELIGTALMRGIPVIVGLNGLNAEAFAEFAGAFAEHLDPSGDAMNKWLDDACAKSPERRAV